MMNRTYAVVMTLSALLAGSIVRAEDTNKTEAAPKPAGAPKIVFDKTVYDFGTTSMVSSVTGTFTFHNAGDAVLEVKKPQPSCGCTVAGVKPDTLKPGESGELVFTVNIGNVNSRMHLDKHITVPSNDPQNQNVSLTIKTDVVPVFEVNPSQVPLGDLRSGFTTNVVIHLKRTDGKKIEITKVEPTVDWIHAKLVPVEGSNGTEADIRIEATAAGASRPFNYQVRGFSENPAQPAVTIPVYGRIVGDLSVTPEAVFYGIADPDRWPGQRPDLTTIRNIRIAYNKPDEKLEVKSLTTSLKDLSVTLTTLETGRVYQVVAKLSDVPKESERGTISLETNLAGQPTIVVPVTINVLRR